MSEKGPQAAGRTPRQLIVREFIHPRDTPEGDKKLALRPDIHVTRKTPPTLLLQAENDYVDGVNHFSRAISEKSSGSSTTSFVVLRLMTIATVLYSLAGIHLLSHRGGTTRGGSRLSSDHRPFSSALRNQIG